MAERSRVNTNRTNTSRNTGSRSTRSSTARNSAARNNRTGNKSAERKNTGNRSAGNRNTRTRTAGSRNSQNGYRRQTDRRNKRRQRASLNKVKSMKLAVMMLIILLAFAGLGGRLYVLARDNQNDYQKRSCHSSAMIPRHCLLREAVFLTRMERFLRRARKCTM